MSTGPRPVAGAPEDVGGEVSDGDAGTESPVATDEVVDDEPVVDVRDPDDADDPLVVDLDDEPDDAREAGEPDATEETPLADELDAELEAEAAEMAPLVELPDRPTFAHDGPARTDSVPTVAPDGSEQVLVRVRGRGRVPARKVRRVIRRVDPISVLKLSFFFNVCVFAMFLVAALLLWSAAIGSGSTDNIESFVVDIGFEDFQLVGADLFRGFVVFGGGLVVAFTVFAVLLAVLFNLISDVVGGIRLTVIEPSLDDAGAEGAAVE